MASEAGWWWQVTVNGCWKWVPGCGTGHGEAAWSVSWQSMARDSQVTKWSGASITKRPTAQYVATGLAYFSSSFTPFTTRRHSSIFPGEKSLICVTFEDCMIGLRRIHWVGQAPETGADEMVYSRQQISCCNSACVMSWMSLIQVYICHT